MRVKKIGEPRPLLVDDVGKRTREVGNGETKDPPCLSTDGACVSVASHLPVSHFANNHCDSLFKLRQ